MAHLVGGLGEDVTEVSMVVDAEADMPPSRCMEPWAEDWHPRCTRYHTGWR